MFLRGILAALLIALAAGQVAHATGFGLLKRFPIAAADSVEEAVDIITRVLQRQGYEIVIVVDHAAAAASVDLDLPPTQVVLFRRIVTDARLIRRGQTTAIDLPLKLLVWEDSNGSIRHKFNGPGYLVDRHDLRVSDWLVSRIDRVLEQFGEQDNGLISVPGSLSVPDTVAVLTSVLADAGFRIPVTIDYAADAAGVRRHLRDTTLIVFGNPKVGTALMQNAREVALDLPQKFLVWEDRHHQTWISYNDPYFIAQRAGVQGLDTLLGNIANALANFANQGANGP